MNKKLLLSSEQMKRTSILVLLMMSMAVSGWAQEAGGEAEEWVNLPLYMDDTASDIPHMYGKIPPFERVDRIDDTYFPAISGLCYQSCLEMCPKDSCEAKRAVLAVNCPDNEVLLRWVSQKACEFTNKCIEDSLRQIRPDLSLTSAMAICEYYINQASLYFKDVVKVSEHDEGYAPIEQRGRFIAEVWHQGQYHTFLVSDWYDQLSCGYNTDGSYITIDSATGEEIRFADLIENERMVLDYLRSHDEAWAVIEGEPGSRGDMLAQMGGCALLKEGLVIYYHPYSIGIGALGEPIFTIPYQSLKNSGITLKQPFDALTEDSERIN